MENQAPSAAPPLSWAASEDILFRKISLRILPILFCCYLMNYIDRVNISFAKLAMSASLGIDSAAYGLGAGLFFIGYAVCQIPSNLLLNRYGARRWIALILFAWGIISASTAFIHHQWEFYIIRFLLGAAEAGFFPGVILYLTWWYPTALRARIVAWFLTAIPVAGLLGGPLSGWIMERVQTGTLQSWQWLFILEALPCLLLALWVWSSLTDHPSDARWLSPSERDTLEDILQREALARSASGAPSGLSGAFSSPIVWVLCVLYFCTMMGLYGLSFWLPQIIKDLGWTSPFQIGLISAVPWCAAIVVMFIWTSSSDRKQERRFHAAGAAALAAAGFLLCSYVQSPNAGLAATSLACAGVLSLCAVIWAVPGALLNGTAAAAGIALINSFGNIGGFVSPTLIGLITEKTNRAASGQYLTAAFLLLAMVLLLSIPALQPKRVDLPAR